MNSDETAASFHGEETIYFSPQGRWRVLIVVKYSPAPDRQSLLSADPRVLDTALSVQRRSGPLPFH